MTTARRFGPRPRSFRDPKTDLRFRFELAERLHLMVADLDDGMTAREFAYWKQLERVRVAERKRELERQQSRRYQRGR
jgi:hypothetical protein